MDIKDTAQLILITGAGIYLLTGLVILLKTRKKENTKIQKQGSILSQIGIMFWVMTDILADNPNMPQSINWIILFCAFVMLMDEILDYVQNYILDTLL